MHYGNGAIHLHLFGQGSAARLVFIRDYLNVELTLSLSEFQSELEHLLRALSTGYFTLLSVDCGKVLGIGF